MAPSVSQRSNESVRSNPDPFSSRCQSPVQISHPYEIKAGISKNKNSEKPASRDFTQASHNPDSCSDQVYVHPLDKGSAFSMSPRSLEMCTETLGSESGSDFYSSVDEFAHLVLPQQSCTKNKPVKTLKSFKKNNFPPPLTSIVGDDKGVKMHSCREGGRLVIKAVFDYSSCGCYFKIERENGRLRMSMMKVKEKEKEEVGVESESFHGSLWGGEWSRSRCNGDGSGSEKLHTLPFCVAIS